LLNWTQGLYIGAQPKLFLILHGTIRHQNFGANQGK
jgi:hypothetical protein